MWVTKLITSSLTTVCRYLPSAHLISSYMGGAHDTSEPRGPKIVSEARSLRSKVNLLRARNLFDIYKNTHNGLDTSTWLAFHYRDDSIWRPKVCRTHTCDIPLKAHLHFFRISQFAVRMRFPNSEFDTHFKSCSDEFNCYKKPMRLDL